MDTVPGQLSVPANVHQGPCKDAELTGNNQACRSFEFKRTEIRIDTLKSDVKGTRRLNESGFDRFDG